MKNFLNNNYKISNKSGFSLVELMILITISTLIISVCTPLITRKHQESPSDFSHGAYLCYWSVDSAGKKTLKEMKYSGKLKLKPLKGYPIAVSNCVFNPPQKATYFQITAIGGGGGGGDSGYSPSYAHQIYVGGVENATLSPFGITEEKLNEKKIDVDELKSSKGPKIYGVVKGYDSLSGAGQEYTYCNYECTEGYEAVMGWVNKSCSKDTTTTTTKTTTQTEEGDKETTCVKTTIHYYMSNTIYYETIPCYSTTPASTCTSYEKKTATTCTQNCTGGGSRTETYEIPCIRADQIAQGNCGIKTRTITIPPTCSGSTCTTYQVNGTCRTWKKYDKCVSKSIAKYGKDYGTYSSDSCGENNIPAESPCKEWEQTGKNCKGWSYVPRHTSTSGGSGASAPVCRSESVAVQPGLSISKSGSVVSSGSCSPNGCAYCQGSKQHNCGSGNGAKFTVQIKKGSTSLASATSSSAYKGGTAATFASDTRCNGGQSINTSATSGIGGSCTAGSSGGCLSLSNGGSGHCYDPNNGNSVRPNGVMQIKSLASYALLYKGNGGQAGEVKTTIVRSLNNVDKTIHIGTGGSPAALGNGKAGNSGSATYMGAVGSEIIRAEGGQGGAGNIPNTVYEKLPPYDKDKDNRKEQILTFNGQLGFSVTTNILSKSFTSSALTGDDFLNNITSKVGKGGQGGGLKHNCWAGLHITTVDDVPYKNKSIFFYPEGTDEGTNPATVASRLNTEYKAKGYFGSRDIGLEANDITKAKNEGRMIRSNCQNDYELIPGSSGLDGALLIRW